MKEHLQSCYSSIRKITNKKEKALIFSYLLFVSSIVITICSTTSFLYSMQRSIDANCFFTVGQAMLDGKVLYRDIYEQKGILTYVIHAIASLVSSRTFIGMYIIEIASLTVTLCLAYKTLRLWLGKVVSLVSLPLFSALIFSSNANVHGDNVEELCFPMVTLAIYYFSRHAVKSNWDFSNKELLLCGISAGLVFWIKFNLLGVHFVWMASIFFALIIKKRFSRAFSSCGIFLVGMFIVTIPVLLYFIINGALSDCLRSYFYNNIFLYTDIGNSLSIGDRLLKFYQLTLHSCKMNKGFAVFLLIGGVWTLFTKQLLPTIGSRITYLAMMFVQTFAIFGPGRISAYYFLALAMLALLGIPSLIQFIHKLTQFILSRCNRKENNTIASHKPSIAIYLLIALISVSLSTGICLLTSKNVGWIKYDKDEFMQYKFSQIINQKENATLLNYGALDQGLYIAAGITPTCKYFCNLNIPYSAFPELMDTQNEFIRSRRTDFVLISNLASLDDIPDFVLENYEIVAQTYQPENSNVYVLLERINDSN